MAGHLPGKPSQQAVARDATSKYMPEGPQCCTRKWYFSRQEIEEDSPSRKDGIDLKKESQLRKLYCSFLQELGKKLKVPQVTIAAAMILCHRFYMRQSHTKNDWQMITTASMFLACKLEETPRSLRDVVVVAFEIMHKWDPSAPQRIRQREVYYKQKESILIGERLLLATIAFDLDVQLPYMPLVTALKRLNIFPDLAKVAWSFVNDWLCTTLCLQYKPHYIAAGSMFLAAKFQKVKLPTEKGKVWWLEFDISPKQLEEVIQQMLKFLEQDRKRALPPTHGKVTQSTDVAGKAVASSPQSCISSASIVDWHSSHKGMGDVGGLGKSIMSDCSQNPTCDDSHVTVKEVLQCLTSNSGCSSSVVEDDDSGIQPRTWECDQNSSYKIVSVHNKYSKIDADRIRETLKRRRGDRAGNKNLMEAIGAQIDSEAWIERELENGVELESVSYEKKQKLVL